MNSYYKYRFSLETLYHSLPKKINRHNWIGCRYKMLQQTTKALTNLSVPYTLISIYYSNSSTVTYFNSLNCFNCLSFVKNNSHTFKSQSESFILSKNPFFFFSSFGFSFSPSFSLSSLPTLRLPPIASSNALSASFCSEFILSGT